MSDSTADAEPSTADAAAEEEPFANRAARRAKGKKSANPKLGAAGPRPMRSGTVQSPRQYGNRRSG
ncbi:hypothetical protein [Pseudosporangium ferrugineum]|uniref:Uncharacterized protein n=1 Tax=Pseudosporangium ferrugineum TaxID=439699 RepID=A0A2T0RFS8_9ACTN|nr:hypothetical protein [Pseudosporangium ferrugineum]PRY19992.1 hypothetical protein CLV70_12630 [Pseudosporangium ferrugineum]